MNDALVSIKSISGGQVLVSEVGHGSFIDLEIAKPPPYNDTIKLWIYLADWVLLRKDEEILASDMKDSDFSDRKPLMEDLKGAFVKYVNTLSADEIHIGFTGHRRLEIWRNREAYGGDSEIIKVFKEGIYVGSL